MQSVENKVLSRVYGHKRGWVFTPGHFLDLGAYSSVARALKGICDRGLIRRLGRGLYYYPEQHPKLGDLAPTPDQIARALAGKGSLRIQPSGAYAANLLGLSLQVPAKVLFLTDGSEREVRVGNQNIILKRTTPKNMATAGRISGLAIQALRHLGKEQVTDEVVRVLAKKLSDDECQQLMKDIKYAPAWIGDVFRRLAAEKV